MAVQAAFPFIVVQIDTSGLTPVVQRAPGVIAIVGNTAAGAAGGTATPDTPFVVSTVDDAVTLFAQQVGTVVTDTPLSRSLKIAMLQNPQPSKIYGVKLAGTDYGPGLSALEGVDDVTFVALANETAVGTASGGSAATDLHALKEHVEEMSAAGQKRIGVAMIDPTVAKTANYFDHDQRRRGGVAQRLQPHGDDRRARRQRRRRRRGDGGDRRLRAADLDRAQARAGHHDGARPDLRPVGDQAALRGSASIRWSPPR